MSAVLYTEQHMRSSAYIYGIPLCRDDVTPVHMLKSDVIMAKAIQASDPKRKTRQRSRPVEELTAHPWRASQVYLPAPRFIFFFFNFTWFCTCEMYFWIWMFIDSFCFLKSCNKVLKQTLDLRFCYIYIYICSFNVSIPSSSHCLPNPQEERRKYSALVGVDEHMTRSPSSNTPVLGWMPSAVTRG